MFISSTVVGLLYGAVVAWLGYQARALTAPGAVAAAIVGAFVYGFGGLEAAILMIFFFVSSSLLTRFKRERKAPTRRIFEKGSQRDAGQVLANGGLPALLVVLGALTGATLPWVGFIGAMGTATGDTWATEVGVLSRRPPRSILNGKLVGRGTSGGVTLLGYAATALGALSSGIVGLLLVDDRRIIPIALVGGLAGATADSFLGAGLQAMYYCTACEAETESRIHHCGAETAYRRGWRWLNNDRVNLIAAAIGAGASMGMANAWLT